MESKKRSALASCCSVCSAPSASHLHYGAVTCYSCRAFFRRGIGKPYCCVEGTGDCSIDWTSRRSCQYCRFDKCLKVGMNPELVDASLRLKNMKKSKNDYDQPTLIKNLGPREKIGIVSDVLRDALTESPNDLFLPVPSYTTCVGEFGDERVFLLQDGILSEQDFLYENCITSPSNSLYSQAESSSTSSLYNSDYSDDIFQKNNSFCDEFSYIVTNYDDVQKGFDICMDESKNIPESIYPVEVQEKEPVLTNNQTSVIVKTNSSERSIMTQYGQNSTTILNGYVSMQQNTSENENVNKTKGVSDPEDKYMMRDTDDEEAMREVFDIETLVEECFLQMQEGS